jgi:hypothetical protein
LRRIGRPRAATRRPSDALAKAPSDPDQRHASLADHLPSLSFVANSAKSLGLGTNENHTLAFTGLGKRRVLRQKAVARMNGVRGRALGCGEYVRNVQIALCRRRGTDANRLVCQRNVHRPGIGLRIQRYGLDAKVAARPNDADRYLAAVGDQQPLDHIVSPVCRRLKPESASIEPLL